MSWPIKLVSLVDGGPPAAADRFPGMAWIAEWYKDAVCEIDPWLAPNYKQDWLGKRKPLIVVLPQGSLWPVDQRPSFGAGTDTGWKVQHTWPGDLSDLHINPSIVVAGYHGWCHNGVLSDDLEGRTYTLEQCRP